MLFGLQCHSQKCQYELKHYNKRKTDHTFTIDSKQFMMRLFIKHANNCFDLHVFPFSIYQTPSSSSCVYVECEEMSWMCCMYCCLKSFCVAGCVCFLLLILYNRYVIFYNFLPWCIFRFVVMIDC